jgi:hypothetical protein
MGFFGAFLSNWKSIAFTAGLDLAVSALSNKPSEKAPDLKDKTFRSGAHGTSIPICRGTVRLQGKDLWGTNIQTSIWKTVSGGLFGIGSKSVYYNKYSESRFIGFGKKLGGGAAHDILRLYADGKLLFNKLTSRGTQTGTVTSTVVGGGQLQGSQFLQIDLASGASVDYKAGDLITIPSDTDPYTVQFDVSGSGPATINIPVWPPLRQTLAGGGAVTLVTASTSGVYDLSSFDPNPHDGSHTAGGYPCPSGQVRFYLGSDTQQPDPKIVSILGAGNVPAYRGWTGVVVSDMQLANYGDHRPAISALVAFDAATGVFPVVGPIPGLPTLTSGGVSGGALVALPFSAASSVNFINPLKPLPYAFVVDGALYPETIYRVNTQTNQVEDSMQDPTAWGYSSNSVPLVVDTDGYFYLAGAGAPISKFDGLAMTLAGESEHHFGDSGGVTVCDLEGSLFGNIIPIKMLIGTERFGGIDFIDRISMCTYGAANSAGLHTVCTGYDSNGIPILQTGDYTGALGTFYSGASALMSGNGIVVDKNGDVWGLQHDTLSKWNCQFQSSVYFDSQGIPHPYLAPPSFARSDYSVASVTGSGGYLFYNAGDATLVIVGDHLGKVDLNGSIVATAANPSGAFPPSSAVDILGTLVIGGSGGYTRVDATSLQVLSTYHVSSYGSLGTGFLSTYDQLTDSVWTVFNQSGTRYLYRLFLDRGNGNGIGLDSIVSSIFLDANYDVGEIDVSQLTSQGLTVGGVEFDKEARLNWLQKLMQPYTFDTVEIDAKMVAVPHGKPSIAAIPEDDLGALDDPTKHEPRIEEMFTDPRDVTQVLTLKHFDYLKDTQASTQEARRITQPHASSLSSAKANTSSRKQVDITTPISENALAMKQRAEILLWEDVASRARRNLKLGPKWMRLDASDVVTPSYKGLLLETRLTEVDIGESFALELQGVSQDQTVYTSAITSSGASSGTGGGSTPTPPVITSDLYTISPAQPLSEVSATDIAMASVTATFLSSGKRLLYNARNFTVPDPGSTPTLYYVTILDPTFIGETPGTLSLTAFCDTNPATAHVGQPGYIFMGTITVTHDGTGVVVTAGGSGQTAQAIGFYVNGSGGTPAPTGNGVSVDVLNYCVHAQRATMHLTGSAANNQGSNFYSYHDPSTHSFAFIKAPAGWAADILLYFSDYIKQYITELDDPDHRLWSVDSAYKKLHSPLPIMPRFITPGAAPTVIDLPAPNLYDRLIACSVIDTKDKGHTTNITKPPVMMNLDSWGNGGGNLGSVSVIVNERYAGGSARERFFFGLNLGLLYWDAASLVSGARITGQYKVTNWSAHTKLVCRWRG